MRRTTLWVWLAALALLGMPSLAGAQDKSSPSSPGEVAVGVQTTSASGDESHFREDSLGERKGLDLELLRYSQSLPKYNFTLDARFMPGGSGWLDMDVTGDRWRGGVRVTRINQWSGDSFANDLLPSGRPVSTLYPGTTRVSAPLGQEFPSQDLIRAEGYLTWRFNRANRLTLRVGSTRRDGDKVPSIGGYSFAGGGNPAFYTAGLEHSHSTSQWASLELDSTFGPVQLNAAAGYLHRDDAREDTLPAYGQRSLLDFNQWNDHQTSDTAWLRLDARWALSPDWALKGGLAYVDTTSDPRGGDQRLTPQGSLRQPGYTILGGHTHFQSMSGAAGLEWRPIKTLSITLAADAQHTYGDGEETLALLGLPWAPAATTRDDVRVGGSALLAWHPGRSYLRLRLSGSTYKENDLKESQGDFAQQSTRTTDRWDARLDFSTPLAKRLSFEGWTRFHEDKVGVEVADLRNGYLPGDWRRKDYSGQLALKYRRSNLSASLSAQTGYAALDNDTPFLDPIFDPSLAILPTSSDQRWNQIWGSMAWALPRGSFWAEAGWLEAKFELPTDGFQSYAPLSERVSGSVTAVGGDAALWQGGTLTGQIQWVKNTGQQQTELVRGSLRLEQRVSKNWSTYLRWGYWDLSDPLAASSRYTVHVITAGVRATF
jgi:hypothetical protein